MEIKKCPFCGTEGKVCEAWNGMVKYYFVKCYGDDCPVNPETNLYADMEKAAERWNVRR